MQNSLGITAKEFGPTADSLNILLSNYQIYYQNLRNFHWNVRGRQFFELHRKFEELYTEARTTIDLIAERLLTIHHRPLSNMTEYLKYSDVDEAGTVKKDFEMVSTIIDNHNHLINQMRDVLSKAGDISDEGTIDLIASDLQRIEKHSWMLDAWSAPMHENVNAN